MPLLLRTHQSLAQSKFPLCHPPAARVGWTHEEEAVGRQLFPARLRGRVRVGCAWDCSLPTPSAPLRAAAVSGGERRWGRPPSTPSPGCKEAPRRLQGKPEPKAGYKPLPAGQEAPAWLRPTPPGLEGCTFTSRRDFRH